MIWPSIKFLAIGFRLHQYGYGL